MPRKSKKQKNMEAEAAADAALVKIRAMPAEERQQLRLDLLRQAAPKSPARLDLSSPR